MARDAKELRGHVDRSPITPRITFFLTNYFVSYVSFYFFFFLFPLFFSFFDLNRAGRRTQDAGRRTHSSNYDTRIHRQVKLELFAMEYQTPTSIKTTGESCRRRNKVDGWGRHRGSKLKGVKTGVYLRCYNALRTNPRPGHYLDRSNPLAFPWNVSVL